MDVTDREFERSNLFLRTMSQVKGRTAIGRSVSLALLLAAFATAAWKPSGAMEALSAATLEAAAAAVPLALGLVGVMALFLGVMKVAEAAGVLAGHRDSSAGLTSAPGPADGSQDSPHGFPAPIHEEHE